MTRASTRPARSRYGRILELGQSDGTWWRCPDCRRLRPVELRAAHQEAEEAIREDLAMKASSESHPVYAPRRQKP